MLYLSANRLVSGTQLSDPPRMRSFHLLSLFAVPTVALALGYSSEARADDTIKHPGEHPDYHVELEPHFVLGWPAHYAGWAYGLGGRVSIPIVKNGFISTINNSVAIGFGIDWLHYSGCYYDYNFAGYGCYGPDYANYLYFPVVMQWNFFVAQHWSVFGEPGFYIYHGWFDYPYYYYNYCGPGPRPFCNTPTDTGIDFAFFAGGRYHFNDNIALTMRIGYPYFSIGASFMF